MGLAAAANNQGTGHYDGIMQEILWKEKALFDA